MNNHRIYVIDIDCLSDDAGTIHYTELSDEEFITEAELQGSVYGSLEQFQLAFNHSEVNTSNQVIRIIEDKQSFAISSLSRDDLKKIVPNDKIRNSIPDYFMERIASKLGDDYCEQLFWSSLKIIAEYVLEDINENKQFLMCSKEDGETIVPFSELYDEDQDLVCDCCGVEMAEGYRVEYDEEGVLLICTEECLQKKFTSEQIKEMEIGADDSENYWTDWGNEIELDINTKQNLQSFIKESAVGDVWEDESGTVTRTI